jgi:predicted RNA-binding protein YlqC (UPF0109 family)
VSAFDDEFGLFGDEDAAPDEERKPTLGARQIATGETIIDEIEPEDERPARRHGGNRTSGGTFERRPPRDHGPRPAGDPALAQARAVELLRYLATKLVSKADEVIVEVVDGPRGPIIELEVHPDDFGKVIGKGGRVAQALRTIVRACAEGKVTIDIVDVEDDDELEADPEHAVDTVAAPDEAEAEAEAVAEEPVPEDSVAEEPAPVKKPAARKKRAAPAGGRKKKA